MWMASLLSQVASGKAFQDLKQTTDEILCGHHTTGWLMLQAALHASKRQWYYRCRHAQQGLEAVLQRPQ